ncbi:NAD(+) diphosphatase [Alteromonas facilis]|uniref:NAD(+) diphosphatase n=1 Tax=Alteromonas facilis TaxID=2048004 RepID=UPI000C294A57|nr:NAD(+) diphosphatase [Alteromonas facilis]
MIVDVMPATEAYWLVVSNDRFLRDESEQILMFASWSALTYLEQYQDKAVPIGEYDGHPVILIDMQREEAPEAIPTSSLRSALMYANDDQFGLIAKAWQYAVFLRTHRYCGQCGSTMQRVNWEMAMHCYQCHHRTYPRVSPCIIVAIHNEDSLLLALGTRHKDTGMYSTLAGFVESGESLEEALHREVKEEVGVDVKNIEYFGSQPWPFPHSLMVGYIAEYAGGDIVIDDEEICAADWFRFDQLPKVPPTLSIAGQLIEETVRRLKDKQKSPT